MRVLQTVSGSRFTCLMLALTAREMLQSRGIESRLILGVERAPNHNRKDPFGAHAWVIANGLTVVGAEGSDRFTPVAVYGAYRIEANITMKNGI